MEEETGWGRLVLISNLYLMLLSTEIVAQKTGFGMNIWDKINDNHAATPLNAFFVPNATE